MKKIVALILALSFVSVQLLAGGKKENVLQNFVQKMKNAKDISFDYRVSTLEGFVSISKDALYLSQRNRIEIYETPTTRYTYNKKRNKVDIDRISNNSNNISLLMGWIERVDRYDITTQEPQDGGPVRYKLVGRDAAKEEIEILFSSDGVITQLSYQSSSMKKLTIHLNNFKMNGPSTSEYFTFDPSKRSDMEVTDYRQ